MPHFPKPFFRASRGLWYVQIAGKQHNLGPDEDAAFKAYHELMSKPPEKPVVVATQSVVAVVDAFLDYVSLHRSRDTYRWYKDRLDLFCNFIPRGLPLTGLKPYHVQQWIDSYPALAPGSKRNHCRLIQRAMKWAEEQGYVDRSPLAHFRKPSGGKREQTVLPAHYVQLLAHTKDQEFKDLLIITWETGCRPQESLRVEARHVDVDHSRWVFPVSEAKGGKVPRIVYLRTESGHCRRRLYQVTRCHMGVRRRNWPFQGENGGSGSQARYRM